jgi:hypothetical protein
MPASGRRSIAFWTLDRRDLKAIRFRAERRREEVLAALGESVQAVRDDMTAAGIPAALYRARFWLRSSDSRSTSAQQRIRGRRVATQSAVGYFPYFSRAQ